MKTVLAALALLSLAPVANAQIVINPPVIGGPPRGEYRADYWRHNEGREDEWRRREEFREEEHRREGWQRSHCVRDYAGQEFCRR